MDKNLEKMSRDELYRLIDELSARASCRRLADYSEREEYYNQMNRQFRERWHVDIIAEYQRQKAHKRKKPNT